MAVTTTDLGKIMLTNGGEYNPNATYEKMTFVLYQNSTYLALQTVTGIEPSNDLVNWQLMAKGFAGSETQIEGYVFVDNEEVIAPAADPALDADKLGGNLPDYYAPQHEISDSFSETKSYAVGDYCIYLNALYRFTRAKTAGAWDGAAVVPVTMAQEIAAINNNFSLYGNASRFLIGSDANDPEFLQVYNPDGKFYQLVANKNGFSFWGLEDGPLTKVWEVALKSDLLDYLKIIYFSASVTLPANGSKVVSIPFTTPLGYRIVTVINARAEGSEIVTFNVYNSGSNIMVNTRNVASAQATQTVYAGVLFVKS